eukprot:619025-Prymnesium_polylepis.1
MMRFLFNHAVPWVPPPRPRYHMELAGAQYRIPNCLCSGDGDLQLYGDPRYSPYRTSPDRMCGFLFHTKVNRPARDS